VSLSDTVPIVRSRVPSLVTVIVLVVLSLVSSISLLPKLIVPEGAMVMFAVGALTPAPLRVTATVGSSVSSELIVTAPVYDVSADDVRRTVIVALPPPLMTVLSAMVWMRL
jgi:hypothetical protein